MREAKVISGNGLTVQIQVLSDGKEKKVSEAIFQVPEEIYETEENVVRVPAKSIWLNAHAVKELRDFLNEMYEKEE